MTLMSLVRSLSSNLKQSAPSCQGNPAGGAKPALTAARSVQARKMTGTEIIMSFTITALILSTLGNVARAADITTLTKGSYVPTELGCDHVGGASTINYDGVNISFHYTVCKTELLHSDSFRNTCVEAQGQAFSKTTLMNIDKNPDKTIVDMKFAVSSPTEFKMDGKQYKYCEIE